MVQLLFQVLSVAVKPSSHKHSQNSPIAISSSMSVVVSAETRYAIQTIVSTSTHRSADGRSINGGMCSPKLVLMICSWPLVS